LRDPILQQWIREDKWINTASARRWLQTLAPRIQTLPPRARKRIAREIVSRRPIEEAVRVFALRYGVEPSAVPKRPLWRSSKHEDDFTIDSVARLLDRSPKTVHNYLSKYRWRFVRHYRRAKDHPRRLRVLTDQEVDLLFDLAGQPPRWTAENRPVGAAPQARVFYRVRA
jgi:Putative ATPase subunit of terminase (gpP-like)